MLENEHELWYPPPPTIPKSYPRKAGLGREGLQNELHPPVDARADSPADAGGDHGLWLPIHGGQESSIAVGHLRVSQSAGDDTHIPTC